VREVEAGADGVKVLIAAPGFDVAVSAATSLSTVHPLQKVSCYLHRTFYDLRQRSVHEEGPPHYEEKAEIEHTALLQVERLQGSF